MLPKRAGNPRSCGGRRTGRGGYRRTGGPGPRSPLHQQLSAPPPQLLPPVGIEVFRLLVTVRLQLTDIGRVGSAGGNGPGDACVVDQFGGRDSREREAGPTKASGANARLPETERPFPGRVGVAGRMGAPTAQRHPGGYCRRVGTENPVHLTADVSIRLPRAGTSVRIPTSPYNRRRIANPGGCDETRLLPT
jgi:hypothetical protein